MAGGAANLKPWQGRAQKKPSQMAGSVQQGGMHTIAYFRTFVQGARKISAEMGLFSNALGL
jgi:hypothetical protein